MSVHVNWRRSIPEAKVSGLPGGWECKGPSPWIHHVTVDVGDYVLRVTALEIRLTTELERGRPDRWRPLLAHLGEIGDGS